MKLIDAKNWKEYRDTGTLGHCWLKFAVRLSYM